MKSFLTSLLLIYFLVLEASAFASFLDRTVKDNLTFSKHQGRIGLQYSFMRSHDLFDSNKDKIRSVEQYVDHIFLFDIGYGLTDEISLRIQLPFGYRMEDDLSKASDMGLGDIVLSVYYRIFKHPHRFFQSAVRIAGKFPSGDSSIAYKGTNPDSFTQLPLGSGQTDVAFSLLAKEVLSRFSSSQEFGYRHRFSDIVEYKRAVQQYTDPTTNQLVTAAVGNGEIEFGDELFANLSFLVDLIEGLSFGAEGNFIYFFSGSVEDYAIDFTTITRNHIKLPSGYIFHVLPQARINFLNPWEISLGVKVPLLGKNYPVEPLVQSLVGIEYILEVSYAF
jgi:hypothetical protein